MRCMAEDTDRAERSEASGIGEIMGQVARALQEEHGDVAATLEANTRAAVQAAPGAGACGINLVSERTVASRCRWGR